MTLAGPGSPVGGQEMPGRHVCHTAGHETRAGCAGRGPLGEYTAGTPPDPDPGPGTGTGTRGGRGGLVLARNGCDCLHLPPWQTPAPPGGGEGSTGPRRGAGPPAPADLGRRGTAGSVRRHLGREG